MTILVTGFDPFDNAPERNPSASVAMELNNPAIDTCILPTSYARAIEHLDNRLRQGDITFLLLLGYAKNIPGIRLEKCARNRVTAQRPDNDGVILHGPIDSTGPDVLPTKVDLTTLGHTAAVHCPVITSTNAGGYVCNYTYYHALRHWPSLPSLFIHLSASKESRHFPEVVAAIESIALKLKK